MCASVTVRPSGLRRRSISERTRRPVSSANIRDWSRIGLRRAFETILVMEAAEDRLGDNTVPVRNSALRRHGNESSAVGNGRPEARVRTPGVVMGDPLAKHGSEMILAHRNHPIEVLAPNGANEPL